MANLEDTIHSAVPFVHLRDILEKPTSSWTT
jgi:hypothetical protein